MLLPVLAIMMTAVPPAFETYCFECHGDGMAKGGLSLDEVLPTPTHHDAEAWLALRSRLTHRDMPPKGEPRPTAAEYEQLEHWISEQIMLLAVEAATPGRVEPRRLNNVEYAETIESLFGVTVDVANRFPADTAGEGFDTTADVLAMPPLLLEKYFDVAEEVAQQSIHDEDNPGWIERRVEAGVLKTRGRVSARRGVQWMPSRGAVSAVFQLPRSGMYLISFGAYGQQAGDEPVRMELRVDGVAHDVVEVAATQSTPGVYERKLELIAGPVDVELVFVNDYYSPNDPDPSQRDRNAAVQWLAVSGPVDVVEPTAFQSALPTIIAGEHVDSHVRRMLEQVLPQVWRRPVDAADVESMLALALETCGPESSSMARLRICITAMLVSPSFLFRIEAEPTNSLTTHLSDHELATRMSYFLWSTTPDDQLRAAAADGTLRSASGRRGQIDRLLDDPQSVALAQNFATQWLQIRSLGERTPDPGQFPNVGPALLRSMENETVALFDTTLREDHSVWELLASEHTVIDEALAEHYALEWPEDADGTHRFSIDAPRARGIMGHASILTATSNPTRTSPVKRGKWVLEVLLDDPVPPPPPDVDALPKAEGEHSDLGVQELLALHTSDPGCRACHARMDPLGLAMESFDAVGGVRSAEAMAGLNLQATLPGGRTFNGPQGLQHLLIGDPAFLRSIARHMLVYALGRGTVFADEALILHLVSALQEDPTMRRLILEIVESDAFRMRIAPQGGGA